MQLMVIILTVLGLGAAKVTTTAPSPRHISQHGSAVAGTWQGPLSSATFHVNGKFTSGGFPLPWSEEGIVGAWSATGTKVKIRVKGEEFLFTASFPNHNEVVLREAHFPYQEHDLFRTVEEVEEPEPPTTTKPVAASTTPAPKKSWGQVKEHFNLNP